MAVAVKDNTTNIKSNNNETKNAPTAPSSTRSVSSVEKIKKQDPINLLPTEFRPNSSVVNFGQKLNKVALISLVVFLIFGITSLASIFLLRYRVGVSQGVAKDLSTQVSAMEQTEQRLILIKDRLTKIDSIRSSASLYDTVVIFKHIYDNIPEGLEIVSAEINSRQINTNVEFDNSSELARFLAQTVSDGRYNLIKINSLEFNNEGKLSMQMVIGT